MLAVGRENQIKAALVDGFGASGYKFRYERG